MGDGGVVTQVVMPGKTVDTDLLLYFPNNSKGNTELLDRSNYIEDMKFDKSDRICTEIDLNVGVKRIFAAGDCASVPFFANSERFKFWNFAQSIVQGMTVGFNMNAMGVPISVVPYREFDFYGHKFREIGSMNFFEEMVLEGDPKSFDFMAYYLNKGVGVMKAAGFPKEAKDMQVLRECMRTNIPIGGDPENPMLFNSVNVKKLERQLRVDVCDRSC